MNRRRFFAALCAPFAAPFVKYLPKPKYAPQVFGVHFHPVGFDFQWDSMPKIRVGDTIKVRMPARFIATNFGDAQPSHPRIIRGTYTFEG